jgi:hypothetical protein
MIIILSLLHLLIIRINLDQIILILISLTHLLNGIRNESATYRVRACILGLATFKIIKKIMKKAFVLIRFIVFFEKVCRKSILCCLVEIRV